MNDVGFRQILAWKVSTQHASILVGLRPDGAVEVFDTSGRRWMPIEEFFRDVDLPF